MLGHVIPKPFNSAVSCHDNYNLWLPSVAMHQSAQYYNEQLQTWLNFVDVSNVKAFSEITICSSIRTGVQNLLAVSSCF